MASFSLTSFEHHGTRPVYSSHDVSDSGQRSLNGALWSLGKGPDNPVRCKRRPPLLAGSGGGVQKANPVLPRLVENWEGPNADQSVLIGIEAFECH